MRISRMRPPTGDGMDASPLLIGCEWGSLEVMKGGLAVDGIECQSGSSIYPLTDGGPEMNRTTYGLDIAKNVMQLHWIDGETGEIGRKKLARAKLSEFFAQRQ